MRFAALALLLLAACGESPMSDEDAGPTTGCTVDADCTDAIYCNGTERCVAGSCEPGERPCVDTMCVEAEARCDDGCPDADGDGTFDAACGGSDCDDSDPERYPGNTEVCDPADHDEDCDPSTFGFRDADGDLFPDAACCNGDNCGNDCDDAFAGAHPGEAESCDTVDNDCDGSIDEGTLRMFYPDADDDMAGDASAEAVLGCNPPVDHVENATDCDDTDPDIGPTQSELCEPGCDPGDTDCVDENCDGVALSGDECECTGDETTTCCGGRGTRMCDDTTGTFGACSISGVAEECNGVDDNCNGEVDEGVTSTCYRDADEDGFAPAGAETEQRCVCMDGWTGIAPTTPSLTDCDDSEVSTFPGAGETCDNVDSDCSEGGGAATDEDGDGDGYAAIGAPCSGGFPRSDCNDADAAMNPGVPNTSWFTSPANDAGCSGDDCWDYDCDGRVLKENRREGPSPADCSTLCADRGFCRANGFQGGPDAVACGERAPFDQCGSSCGSCEHSTTMETMGCR